MPNLQCVKVQNLNDSAFLPAVNNQQQLNTVLKLKYNN